MQAATHLAGAALTLAVARGYGLPVGPFEAGALFLGSLLPDVDTTTAGAGRYVRPLASWLEQRFGHRTITHSLAFAVAVCAPVWFLSPTVALALFWGIFSHLVLDTMNVNGLPFLLWPWRHTFWFFTSRSSRIRYGSPQETNLAVGLALAGLVAWPFSADGFDTALRRFVASPETAVVDYLKWRESREVWVQLDGFNSETQEPVRGRLRVVEALGRNGVLVEDDGGNLLQVSKNGQVVAYRVRAYPGDPLTVLDSRVSVGGRLVRDLLDAAPKGARVWLTGELELSAPVRLPPPAAGTFARLTGEGERLVLHAARPADLAPVAASYIVAGSLVVRVEGRSGSARTFTLPARAARTEARTVRLDGLPSLAGVLVERGARVLEGQPLARYVQTADLAELDATAAQKRQALAQARAQIAQARTAYQQQRDALTRELSALRPEIERLRFLVSKDAEPRQSLEEAEARARAVESKLTALSVDHSADAADARARADALALELQQLQERRTRAETAQVVRSPLAGQVAEVRVKDATAAGVSVEIVIVSEVHE